MVEVYNIYITLRGMTLYYTTLKEDYALYVINMYKAVFLNENVEARYIVGYVEI